MKKGFTLIEILLAILLVGLLFVYLTTKLSTAGRDVKEAAIKVDFNRFKDGFEITMRENAGFIYGPEETVNRLNKNLDEYLKFSGETSAKKDPWNNNYKVKVYGREGVNNGKIIVCSAGKDGIFGNADDYLIQGTYIDDVTDITTQGLMHNIGETGDTIEEIQNDFAKDGLDGLSIEVDVEGEGDTE